MKLIVGLSKWKDIWKKFSGSGIYPSELAFLLDSPIRKIILSPKKLIDRLHLSTNFIVLEIGSGPGYFSIEAAKRIPAGHLVLFDIQFEMLKKSTVKLERSKIKNAKAVQGNAVALPFGNQVFNVVFLVTVLGEVDDVKRCIVSINKVLKPGGTLSITEMLGDPDVLSYEEINNILIQCGFEFLEKHSSFKGFTLNYKKVFNL